MLSSFCDKDSAIIFTTDRLPDVNQPSLKLERVQRRQMKLGPTA
jgi:hypothetical protein